METKLSEKIREFLTIGSGSGYGSGYGLGSGSGSGSGYGSGDGSGYGSGYGRGITSFCGDPVYMVDEIPTIIRAVFGNTAKGYILNMDLTLQSCYIVKRGDVFAHGETLAEAVQAAEDKLFDDMPEDERIASFWRCHERGVKYPAADFFAWHHRLTGSCEMGRKTFAADHGIDLENDTYTVEEFVKICGGSYGGRVIMRLLE